MCLYGSLVLLPQNDGPDEAKGESRVAINYILSTNVLQVYLKRKIWYCKSQYNHCPFIFANFLIINSTDKPFFIIIHDWSKIPLLY